MATCRDPELDLTVPRLYAISKKKKREREKGTTSLINSPIYSQYQNAAEPKYRGVPEKDFLLERSSRGDENGVKKKKLATISIASIFATN